MKLINLLISGCCLATAPGLVAQELNCTVEVNTQQVQGQETTFEALREGINEYMNSTKFSSAKFSPNEKIECRLYLTVAEYTDDKVKGDIQIQSSRPVYNSSYTSTLLNFKDTKVEFEYRPNQQMVFSENTMEDNLTALLNYYAYLILALDFDSFSSRGGQPYYERLQNIVQMAQSSGEIGWKTYDDNRNRAAVLAALTEPNTQVIRDLIYDYHRRGLDEMSVAPDKGRATITKALPALEQIREKAPMSVVLTMWHDAKLDELINVYSKGSQSERDEVYKLLSDLYPTDQARLADIKNPPETR